MRQRIAHDRHATPIEYCEAFSVIEGDSTGKAWLHTVKT